MKDSDRSNNCQRLSNLFLLMIVEVQTENFDQLAAQNKFLNVPEDTRPGMIDDDCDQYFQYLGSSASSSSQSLRELFFH